MIQVKVFLPHQEGDDFSSQPVLLWCRKTRMMRDYPFALKKVLKLIRHVFAAIIKAQDLDAGRELSLKKCKKSLKDLKNFSLSPEKVNPSKATKVINESNKVLVMCMRNNMCNPPNITMNNIETLRGTRCVMRKR